MYLYDTITIASEAYQTVEKRQVNISSSAVKKKVKKI